MKLAVKKSSVDEVYKDMARIPEEYRKDHNGRTIPEGRICKLKADSFSTLLSLRGKQGCTDAAIFIDEKTRNELNLVEGSQVEFNIRQVWWIGQFCWAWHASDPAYRIAARMGAVSVFLGILGLVLGTMGIYISFKSNGCIF